MRGGGAAYAAESIETGDESAKVPISSEVISIREIFISYSFLSQSRKAEAVRLSFRHELVPSFCADRAQITAWRLRPFQARVPARPREQARARGRSQERGRSSADQDRSPSCRAWDRASADRSGSRAWEQSRDAEASASSEGRKVPTPIPSAEASSSRRDEDRTERGRPCRASGQGGRQGEARHAQRLRHGR